MFLSNDGGRDQVSTVCSSSGSHPRFIFLFLGG
jgi:hypothetical protein